MVRSESLKNSTTQEKRKEREVYSYEKFKKSIMHHINNYYNDAGNRVLTKR